MKLKNWKTFFLLTLIFGLVFIAYFLVQQKSGPRAVTTDIKLYPAVYDDDRPIMKKGRTFHTPRILHFQWKDEMIPDVSVNALKSWKTYHRNWTFMLWTDKMMVDFVDKVYGRTDFAPFYKKLPRQILRVDLMRYVILYHLGGIYADTDMLVLHSLEDILDYHSCVIAREPEPYAVSIGLQIPLLASNVLMISIPGHPFWMTIIHLIMDQKPTGDTLVWVGPIKVTEAVRSYNRISFRSLDTCVFLAPTLYFYPPTSPKGDAAHLTLLSRFCGGFEKSKTSPPFALRICRIYRKENRIDWSDLYKHERHFNFSFARHLQTTSWDPKFAVRKAKNHSHISTIMKNFVTYQSQTVIKETFMQNPFNRAVTLSKS